MFVKFSHRDLNPGHYPSHLTSTYNYKVTTAPRVCCDIIKYFENKVT